MDRRTFLKAVTAGTVVLAGCQDQDQRNPGASPRQSPTTEPTQTAQANSTPRTTQQPTTTTTETATATSEERDLTTVGADVADGEDVSDVIRAIDSGERLVFPPGRFEWREGVQKTADHWGLRCHDETVFEVPEGIGDGDGRQLLATFDRDRTADDVQLENLTFDSAGRAAPSIAFGVRNTGRIDGLRYRMNGPTTVHEQENGLVAFVENDDGRLYVNNYRQYNNGDIGGYGNGNTRVGIFVGPRNKGTVNLRNPILQGFPNNACYVSRHPGTVHIDGGLLTNNNVSAVRVSGGVVVRNTTIYIDTDHYLDGPGVISGAQHNTRGVWGDSLKSGSDGGYVTGVSCILKSVRRSTGLATMLQNRKMSVRNCQFLLDAEVECVRASSGEIEIRNCSFSGHSDDSTAGVGDITGPGGHIASNIDPGAVPVLGRNAGFDWSRTHPLTPGRSAQE